MITKKTKRKCIILRTIVRNYPYVYRELFGHIIACDYFLGASVFLKNFFSCCLLTPTGKSTEEVIVAKTSANHTESFIFVLFFK